MTINLYFFRIEISITGTGVRNQVRKVYKEKGKLEAIKLHRSLTNSSLLDAKNYVEQVCPKPFTR